MGARVWTPREYHGADLVDDQLLAAALQESTGLDALTIGCLRSQCEAHVDGFRLIVQEQWIDGGERIGPTMLLPYDNALTLANLVHAVAERQRDFFASVAHDPIQSTGPARRVSTPMVEPSRPSPAAIQRAGELAAEHEIAMAQMTPREQAEAAWSRAVAVASTKSRTPSGQQGAARWRGASPGTVGAQGAALRGQ